MKKLFTRLRTIRWPYYYTRNNYIAIWQYTPTKQGKKGFKSTEYFNAPTKADAEKQLNALIDKAEATGLFHASGGDIAYSLHKLMPWHRVWLKPPRKTTMVTKDNVIIQATVRND